MSSKFKDKQTTIPAEFLNAVDTLVFGILNQPDSLDDIKNLLGLTANTLYNQNKSEVSITGGFIDNVSLGTQSEIKHINAKTIEVSEPPVSDNQVLNLKFYTDDIPNRVADASKQVVDLLGTLSKQNANNVAIVGGKINNTTIGADVPSSGRFLTLIVESSPQANNEVVNLGVMKNYVASQLVSLSQTNNANITGGSINGTSIGNTAPSTGKFSTLKTDNLPSADNDVVNLLYLNQVMAQTNTAFGTLASQNANNVSISGGVINSARIGNLMPEEAWFKSVTLNQNVSKITLSTPATDSSSISSIKFLLQGVSDMGELSYVPSGNSAYTAPVLNSVFLSGTNGLTLKGQNTLVSLTNGYGVGVLYGSNTSVLSFNSTPSVSLGANSGNRGVLRLYGTSNLFSTVQAFNADLYIDSKGKLALNSGVENSANIELSANVITFNSNGAGYYSLFNKPSYDTLLGGVLQLNGGATFDEVYSEKSLLNISRSVVNTLTKGATLGASQVVAGMPNPALRIVNLWDGSSADLNSNSPAIEFCYKNGNNIPVTIGTDSKPRVSSRISTVSAFGLEPQVKVEIDNSIVNRMVTALAVTTRGHLVLEERTDNQIHAVQANDPLLSGGYDCLMPVHTITTPTFAIDAASNRTFYLALQASTAVTFSGLNLVNGIYTEIVLWIRQDSTGGRTLNFSVPITYTNTNTLKTTADSVSILKLRTITGGTYFIASYE